MVQRPGDADKSERAPQGGAVPENAGSRLDARRNDGDPAPMGFVQTKNPDVGLAKRIYRMAAKAAGGNEELFKKIVAQDLARAGFPIPKKFVTAAAQVAASAQAAAPVVRKAAPTAAKVGLVAVVAGAAPAVVAGLAVVGVISLGVVAWRRYGTWPRQPTEGGATNPE